ncbi:MAG: hemolysin family protein [Actinomycetota bacterium]
MSVSDIWQGAAIISLLGMAAVLAAGEVAVTRMNRVRALGYEEDNKRGARSLTKIVEQPARYLNVILLLVLICHTTATTLAARLASEHHLPAAAVIATVLITTLIFIVAEVTPKTFAVQHTDRVALRLAPFVLFLGNNPLLSGLTKGLIAIANFIIPGRGLKEGPFVTEADLKQYAEVAASEEEIEVEEKEMIHSIFEFGDTVVREVMVPRPDMITIETDSTPRQALTLMLKNGFSRVPAYEESSDNIVGLVYAKDIMRKLHGRKKEFRLKEILRPAIFVPESKKIAELLREMQKSKTHMAIVADEYGDVAGLVTIEDLLEEIVGEIADEYDREDPPVQPVDSHTVRVNGHLTIEDLNEVLDTELPNDEWDTVGGLMAGILGRIPNLGDEVTVGNITFRAEQVQGRRIAKVLVTSPVDVPASNE